MEAIRPTAVAGGPRLHPLAARPRSAARRFSASARNTPFGNCSRYASKSAGFVLFTIDCQNRPSKSAVAAAGCCPAVDAAREAAGASVSAPPAVTNSPNVKSTDQFANRG